MSRYFHQSELSREVVDSAQCIDFDESQESVVSDIGVHTESSMVTMQDAVNKLKDFFVDSSPISEFDFAKNQVFIPKNKELKGRRSTQVHMLLR